LGATFTEDADFDRARVRAVESEGSSWLAGWGLSSGLRELRPTADGNWCQLVREPVAPGRIPEAGVTTKA
jgi:hypothetical protein